MPDTVSSCHLKGTSDPPNLPLIAIDGQRRLVAAERSGTPCPVSLKNVGVSGVIISGGSLSKDTIEAVNAAATTTRRFVAYEDVVRVGGSLSWRANNPGNLRDAPTKIGTVPGAIGTFAVFATLDDGRAAQRDLYLSRYGEMRVRDAIVKLTPPSENDTGAYLANLQKVGVKLDQNVKSQIDVLMRAIEKYEGLVRGIEVKRQP
jgi:hypothetical protein